MIIIIFIILSLHCKQFPSYRITRYLTRFGYYNALSATVDEKNVNPIIDNKLTADVNNGKKIVNKEKIETDYLGMINFCLRPSDNALSGPSRSKFLNEVTDEVFKSIIVGYRPLIEECLNRITMYKVQIETAECGELDDEDDDKLNINTEESVTCDIDIIKARKYLAKLENLLKSGITDETSLGTIYDRGYKRLLTILKDGGCRFVPNEIPTPVETNICLSLLDLKFNKDKKTKTKDLNVLSNTVARAMVYGQRREKDFIAKNIKSIIPDFMNTYHVTSESQEVLYLLALVELLTNGLAAAEIAVTYDDAAFGRAPFGFSNISSSAKDIAIQLDYAAIARKTPNLRLYDIYWNAFQRLVETCFSEISSIKPGTEAQSDELVDTLVNWEQSLRQNLTEPLWKKNPAELAGVWELVNIRGGGSLNPIMTSDDSFVQKNPSKVAVEFLKDGRVDVKIPSSEGLSWYFKPGPSHLDTTEFSVTSRLKPDLVLKYTGFIDRGQRIESRFSKMPIKMTGRVVSIVRGEIRSSNRFVMTLKRDK